MTQYQLARQGLLSPEMVRVAVRECVTPEFIRDEVARGRLVIPANVHHLAGSSGQAPRMRPFSGRTEPDAPRSLTQNSKHKTQNSSSPQPPASNPQFVDVVHPSAPFGHPGAEKNARFWVNQTAPQRAQELADPDFCRGQVAPKRLDPAGIGRMITTKINANIGASPVSSSLELEVEKLRWAQKYGADTLMDLSTGGPLNDCRQALIDHSTIPIGTVPIYSMILGRTIEDLTPDVILKEIEHQAIQGVDYFTIHAGVLREHLPLVQKRLTGIVSRGGSLLAKWMLYHQKQNPMFELFDEISAILRQYDVTYSLGDGLRPGSLADASDPAQLAELHTLGELVQRAREAGVQVMVEGPGHVPLHEVAWNMQTQQRVCDDAPFYVLGPIVTDVFPGYDHITSAIGATEAARAGAAMLCYVTPKEHVGLPKADDVKQGCIAYKIAAHAGDIARGIQHAGAWDNDLSRARAALNWPRHFELAFDGETARALHDEDLDVDTDFCAMCGHDWCSLRISKEIQEFYSGKADGFVPAKKALQSPGITAAAAELLKQRGILSAPEVHKLMKTAGKIAPCHSTNLQDEKKAKAVQKRVLAHAHPSAKNAAHPK